MTWTIKSTDASYRFLSRYHPDYRKHAKGKLGIGIAQDKCSYYKTLILTAFTVLMGAITIIGIPYFLLMLLKLVEPTGPKWMLVLQFIASFLGGLASLVLVIFVFAVIAMFFVKYFVRVFYAVMDFFFSDDPNVTTKSLFQNWRERTQNQFCETVEYVKD